MADEMMRRMPFSMEAEQCVIGSILIDPAGSFGAIGNLLTADDFYVEEHRFMYRTLVEMYGSSREIDPVTLVNALVERGHRDQETGVQYVAQIADMVPSAANIKDYAKIVHNKSLLRRLIDACDDVSAMAYTEEGEVHEIVDSAEQRFFEIAQNRDSKEFRRIRDVLTGVYQGYMDASNNEKGDPGVKTGFRLLDYFLVEMGKGDLVLVGARPGMGKSAFALNVAANVAKSTGKAVCIFSLEMSAEQLVNRMMASEAMVDSNKLRTGNLSPDDWTRLADAAATLSNTNILIDDSTDVTPTQMKAKLRRVQNLGLVVVDYLGLLQSGTKTESRVQEVSTITRNLKVMAKSLSVPIICCAQLSRNVEGKERRDKRPQLSDLRESGSIEQDADVVLFLYRPDYYKTGDEEEKKDAETNSAEIIIAKNRHGALDKIKVGWLAQYTKFINLTNETPPPSK
ncbi:MAG: replicative DNA helicase [Clostridia bacterium]|nr:replicative DNA helicase [Clostridia bacterium]MDY6184588.1 replicative DNA helicase [Eubacteriales bacterium]